MAIRILKRIADLFTAGAILYLLYIGYIVFIQKPIVLDEVVKWYVRMGYAFAVLFVLLMVRLMTARSKSKASKKE